jgi:OOP family OmpA-OmpF porin
MTGTDPAFDFVSGPDGVAIRNTLANLCDSLSTRGPTPDTDDDKIPDSRDRELNTPRHAQVDQYGVARDDDGDGVPNGIDREPNTPSDISMVDEWGVAMDSDHDGVPDDYDHCRDTPVEYAVDREGCPCEILADQLVGVLLNEGVLRERFHFETNSAELAPEAKARLDTIGVSLSGLPDLRFDIEGHCDDLGDDAYNDRLSRLRAQAALDYLAKNFPGLTLEQFTAVGWGKRRPLAPSTDDDSRALNRRVEFRVVNPEEAMRKVQVWRFRFRGEGSGSCGEQR